MKRLSDTFSLSALRKKAADLREQADAIDATADDVQRYLGDESAPASAPTTPASALVVRAFPARAHGGGHKGKAPGTLNMSWRETFAHVDAAVGDGPFDLGIVADALRESQGRENVKPSGLRRQFKGYVEHGYLTVGDADQYQITDKLRALIGAPVHPNENAPPSGEPENGAETAPSAL